MSSPIVIVGAGPVGLMLAGELGLAGVETVVLERQAEPNEHSRGGAINSAVVEMLTQRGIMDSLRGIGMEFPLAQFAHLPLNTAPLAGRHPFSFAIPHSLLERRLEEWAVKLGADVRRGSEVTGLAQDADGVDVTVRSGSAEHTVRASYVVGCDGADSVVRTLAGIDFPGVDPVFYGMLGDFRVGPGNPLLARIGSNQYDRGICTVVPTGPGTIRVITGEFEVAPPDPTAPVTVAEMTAAIARLVGDELAGEPLWMTRWDARTRQAESYRAGRVFVAGDAAHVHFPLGGQALSTGIEDAVNLGWKLAAAVDGWAGPDLLDSYHDERHPVGARACSSTRAQTALMHRMTEIGPLREIFGELIGFADVNAYLVRMAGGLDVRYPMPGEGDLPGTRLPDVPLTVGGDETSVAQLLHTGRGLLIDFTAEATLPAGWSDRVDHVWATPTDRIDAKAVLLRPDGRVAWAAGLAGGDPVAALTTWFGASR
ncbi:FAD-dependent monooxygenase [Micromonospora endolithica]|uniref:FAD-binding domain-containing protein n=1 Tax=Micromonospora endolithica TaxID=230091 RepID=A0A3A9ZPQ4_9ACTN|nr:FAD-dependent monooxygenase [Micromonospora endolithica]RKN50248.1 hypothetical protein D7223_00010 [Micromonospora endolithica]TWJ21111.1 bifunctional hydroxylase/dehydrase [Micromonospora endolithica]